VAQRQAFGITPALALLALGSAALAVGALLLAFAHLALGIALVGVGVVLAAAFLAAARRKPKATSPGSPPTAIDRVRDRAGFAATALTTRSRARRDLARIRAELGELERARGEQLLALGSAVYAGDDSATESVRAELDRLDGEMSAKEAEMAVVIERANERLARARLETQPTEVVEPPGGPATPQPPTIPEPVPVPHEPPEPPTVPEPTPVPHEPPEPPTVPEPTPVPHEPPQQPDIPEPHPEPERQPPPGGSTQQN
jgi:membrane protein implicated in regulation of membrane protease activity